MLRLPFECPVERLVRAGALVAIAATLVPSTSLAGFGSPIQKTGTFGLGIVTRSYTRDVYDIEEDALSNPDDSFGYLAFESRMGLWGDRIDLGLEVGRSHNKEDDFPDRDFTTWEMGIALRGLAYERKDGKIIVAGGGYYRETVGFDRGPTLSHKLRRNLAFFGTIGRRFELGGRRAEAYVGPLYSKHEFFDFGAGSNPNDIFGEGETRNNVQLLVGFTARAMKPLELTGEFWTRDLRTVSFALSALYSFD